MVRKGKKPLPRRIEKILIQLDDEAASSNQDTEQIRIYENAIFVFSGKYDCSEHLKSLETHRLINGDYC